MSNICTPYYDNQYTFTITSGAVATNTAILHPNIYYIGDSWSSTNSPEFWNYGNTVSTTNNNTVKKTIYSPSPTSFSEPKTASHTGFSTIGDRTRNFSQFNVSGVFNKGWSFYCQLNFTGTTIFIPALGSRYNNGISDVGIAGTYWFAGPLSSNALNFALNFYFHISDYLDPLGGQPRTIGCTMRPVLE